MLSLLMLVVSCNKKDASAVDELSAIPQNVVMVVRSNNVDTVVYEIKNGTHAQSVLSVFYSQKTAAGMLISEAVDTIKKCEPTFADALSKNVTIAVKKDGNCALSQIYVTEITYENSKEISSLIENLSKIGTVQERKFENEVIYSYSHKALPSNLYFSVKNHLIVLSFSQKNIEESLQCQNGALETIAVDENFAKISETYGKKEIVNIFVNLQSLTQSYYSELFAENNFVKIINSFNGWAEVDAQISEGAVSFNGFENPLSDTTSFSDLIMTQTPADFASLSMIPENAAFYMQMSLDNIAEYRRVLNEYQKTQNIPTLAISSSEESLTTALCSLISDELAYVVTRPRENAEANTYLVCGLNSQSATELKLQELVGMPMAMNIGGAVDLQYFMIPEGLPEKLFGTFFTNCAGRYVCCVNNYLVFANSSSDLSHFVYDVVLNKTMKTSTIHRAFRKQFMTRSSVFMYFSFANGLDMLKRIFSANFVDMIDENAQNISSLGDFGIQLSNVDGKLYSNIVFAKNEETQVCVIDYVAWENNIEASVMSKPYIVKNHLSNEKEIIFQDSKNRLHLVSSEGLELWNIQLGEPIVGDISQVDAFRNGKLQYLFSTSQKLYLVDRLGNFIDKFPVTFRSKAVASMAVFDYENNQNYRILVPCEDHKIYLYDIKGDIVKGWNFISTEKDVSSDILHYVIGREDFIVFHDKYKFYSIARNGSVRKNYFTNFEFSSNNIYCEVSDNRFITTDVNGTIHRFYVDGHQDSIKIKDFSNGHYFALKDLNVDGQNEFVYTDSSKLQVYTRSGNVMFEYEFSGNISRPLFYRFGNDTKIGIVNYSEEKIYLFDSDGGIYGNFPMKGKTLFSITSFNADADYYNLVVGRDNYLSNYKIFK